MVKKGSSVGQKGKNARKTAEKTGAVVCKKGKRVYAVVEISGSQQLVCVGDKITVNRVKFKEGEQFPVDKVLMTIDGNKVEIGAPYLKNKVAFFKVVEHKKGKKVTVTKFRAKARYRKKKGHRQLLSIVEFIKISSKPKVKSRINSKE